MNIKDIAEGISFFLPDSFSIGFCFKCDLFPFSLQSLTITLWDYTCPVLLLWAVQLRSWLRKTSWRSKTYPLQKPWRQAVKIYFSRFVKINKCMGFFHRNKGLKLHPNVSTNGLRCKKRACYPFRKQYFELCLTL